MQDALKTYVKTLPRHHRIMLFVDSTISELALRNMMEANLHIWGGRYNPIVPVHNNIISKEWLDVIRHFDPDFIYYSTKIDFQFLESLNLFHPREYIEMNNDDPRYHFNGVNIHCLLHEHVHNFFLTNKSILLYYEGNWNMQVMAKAFYQLNLGFRQLYEGENKLTGKLDSIGINEHNAGEINKHLYEQRPYFKSLLSGLHVNSVCLNAGSSWDSQQFEWIVYKKENYLNDLLYFWNRQLYFEPRNILSQVISTIDEIEELLKDNWIEGLLRNLSINNQICLISQSIDSPTLNAMQKKVQSKCSSVRIETKEPHSFPFTPGRVQYTNSTLFKPINNLILGKKDFLKFPTVSFENGSVIDKGSYAIDVVIEKDTKDDQNEIKFPYGTELHFIVCTESSRVNKQHQITIFTNREKQGTDFSIPTDTELIRSVLLFRKKHKELITLPVNDITPSNAGQKLSAFINLFNKDWSVIKQFIEEKFWLQLFRYCSEVKDSSIPSGRGVFSYLDLKNEIDGLFKKYLPQIGENMRRVPDMNIDDEFVTRVVERNKKDTFRYHIYDDLNYLIARSALFVGMKVKCWQCGSNKWYSLSELQDKLPCKGCNSEIIPNLESKVYYKLSDTIINNLLSDLTKNHKQFDGNYVVLKTLLHLKNDSRQSGNSFLWAPCMDFYGKDGENSLVSDLDIVVIQNGKLVIGEAKSDSSEFKSKVKKNIIWAGNNLMPDKIILSCQTGNLDQVVKEINAGLTYKNCTVIPYIASRAWYHFPGIFGLPNEES